MSNFASPPAELGVYLRLIKEDPKGKVHMKRDRSFRAAGSSGLLCSLGESRLNQFSIAIVLVSSVWLSIAAATAHAAPCLIVTLTGTGPGPGAFNGLAGPGTLIRYGEDGNDCGAMKLQFDVGRGTT